MGQLSKHKEGLERENEKLLGEVTHLSQKLNNALEYQNELERKTSMGDLKINELAGQLEVDLHFVDYHAIIYFRTKSTKPTSTNESEIN